MNNQFNIYDCLDEFVSLNKNCKKFNELPLRFGNVRKKSFDFNTIYDKPGEHFTVYAHEDGYRIRKTFLTGGYFGARYQYQMFRNSRTGEWPACKTPKEMFERFEKYLIKKAI